MDRTAMEGLRVVSSMHCYGEIYRNAKSEFQCVSSSSLRPPDHPYVRLILLSSRDRALSAQLQSDSQNDVIAIPGGRGGRIQVFRHTLPSIKPT